MEISSRLIASFVTIAVDVYCSGGKADGNLILYLDHDSQYASTELRSLAK
jgi:hypothetical protein